MKHLWVFIFFTQLVAQKYELSLKPFEMSTFHESQFKYTENPLKQSTQKPVVSMAASFLIPGLGQYLNDDDYKALAFIGVEALGWLLYTKYESDGDAKTKVFEAHANENYSRIKYYHELAKEAGLKTEFEALNLEYFSNESAHFEALKANSELWQKLRKAEEVHSASHILPDTKTQQYYEMIGKYAQFFVGWKNVKVNESVFYRDNGTTFTFEKFSDHEKFRLDPRPDFIQSYYSQRNTANDFYKKADWALRGIFLNHLLSGLEALIAGKKKEKTFKSSYQTRYYKQELVPTLSLSYNF